jgi:hypothetical protein
MNEGSAGRSSAANRGRHLVEIGAAVAVIAAIASVALLSRTGGSSELPRPSGSPPASTVPPALTRPSAALAIGSTASVSAASAGVSAVPSPTPGSSSGMIGPYAELPIPDSLGRKITLPAGGRLYGLGRAAVDGDWVLASLRFDSQPNGHQDQLHVVNVATGESRRLADHSAEGSVAGARVAWVDPVCSYPSSPSVGANNDSCASWELHVTDLTDRSDRVVASGTISGRVSTPVYQYGNGEFILPRAALSATRLAYSSGDLEHGFAMRIVTLATGSQRTLRLGGMVDELRWAGDDLAWIEDTDLRTDGIAEGYSQAAYYSGTRLMLLADGSDTPREIASNPLALEAGPMRVAWTDWSTTRAGEAYTANGPDWQASRLPSSGKTNAVAISGDWIGWYDYQLPVYALVVLKPGEEAPRVIADCYGMSGGMLFLARSDPDTLELTSLRAVRISDIR